MISSSTSSGVENELIHDANSDRGPPVRRAEKASSMAGETSASRPTESGDSLNVVPLTANTPVLVRSLFSYASMASVASARFMPPTWMPEMVTFRAISSVEVFWSAK